MRRRAGGTGGLGDRLRQRASILTLAALAGPLGPALPAAAQASDPPYEQQMLRLAEILGSIHYLRPLCGGRDGNAWRVQMQALLDAEQPDPRRRARLIDRFNVGYSSFAAVHRTCTGSTVALLDRYQQEGAQIARDVALRYGH